MIGDEGIRPCLANFLAVPFPYTAKMQRSSSPSEHMAVLAISWQVRLTWVTTDFKNLHDTLAQVANGWLMPEVEGKELGQRAA